MHDHNHNGQHVRRVTLPSGRVIEVVYFDPADVEAASSDAMNQQPMRDLTICPECESNLVYPVDWEEASPTHWEVDLRCPNCEWTETGTFDQATVDKFDNDLDRGTDIFHRDMRRFVQANMEDEAERFISALRADAVLPEDF